MSDKKDASHDSEPTKYGISNMLIANPLAEQSHEEDSKKKESGSPDHSDKIATNPDSQRPQSPLVGEQAEPSTRITSPQLSKKDTNVLVIDEKKPKTRKNSSSSSSSSSSSDDQKKSKKGNKQDSSDQEDHKSSIDATKQQQKHDSSQTKHDSTTNTNAYKHTRHSSTDTDDLPRSTSKPKQGKQSNGKESPGDNKKRSSSRESKEERLNNSKVSNQNQSKTKTAHTSGSDQSDDEHSPSKSTKKPIHNDHDDKTQEDNNVKTTHSVQDLVNKSMKPSADPNSDTEQTKPKRRRPKRISRTTQTHEYIFRRMEREQHQELLPTNDTDKNIQTRKSQLCPRKRSPKKPYSIYLSTDEYKIEQIKPKKSYPEQENTRKSAPQSGKLLILRPTVASHQSNAVNANRVSLQHAIDLIHKDDKRDPPSNGQRNKSNSRKQPEHKQSFPRVNSASSSIEQTHKTKSNPKEKSSANKK
ncbi:hypothetical protein I4U23_026321 [Adineta vaga]|nr:hypothetical protein I4U23_026321 [Adineta vaga]